MAVPTVTSVEPNSGSTRGRNVVRIIGSNFRPPNPVPAIGYVGSAQQKTVSVKFEGVESEWAYYASDGLILARVPAWTGSYKVTFPYALDVRVANLDDSEVEIPGESATLADGYSINRPSLQEESYLQRVIRELINIYRIHVLENTHHTTSRDFSGDPSSTETLKASTPLVQLVGPRMPLNRFDSINYEEPEEDPLGGADGMMRRMKPVTCDLLFEIRAFALLDRHLTGLVQAILLMHRDVLFVKVLVDPNDPSKGTKDYNLDLVWDGYPELETEPNISDLLSASMTCKIRGVHIDEESGTIVERGWRITQNDGDPVLESQGS